jgi:phosphohistidine phosphatase
MPLVIDILRHGEAEPTSPAGDAGRALAEAGVRQIRALARRLAAEGWRPDVALSSPLLRARQTGELVLEALPDPPALGLLAELKPETEPEVAIATLEALAPPYGHVLLVSHMPLVQRLCARLCGRSEPFRAAALARLELDGGLRPGAAIWRGFPAQKNSG